MTSNAAELIKDLNNLSKEGQTEKAYLDAVAHHKETPFEDTRSQQLFGWIIYRYLKSNLKRMSSRKAREALAVYFKLKKIPHPDMVHSYILVEAVKMAKEYDKTELGNEAFVFISFLELWGVDAFRSEDWKSQKTADGKAFPALVEEVAKAALKSAVLHPGKIRDKEAFESFLQEALRQYPGDMFLFRDYGKYLESVGERDKAVAELKKALLTREEGYLWTDLAEIVGDDTLKAACYSKTLLSGQQEDFLVNVHLSLAEVFLRQRQFGEALAELNAYQKTYDKERPDGKWRKKERFYRLSATIPSGTVPNAAPKYNYQALAKAADEFVFSELPKVSMVVTGGFRSKRNEELATLSDKKGEKIIVKAKALRQKGKHPKSEPLLGKVFLVTLRPSTEERGMPKPILFQPSEDSELSREVEGEITYRTDKNGHPIGFVNRCFIPSDLISSLNPEKARQAKALAVLDKGRWKVCRVLSTSNKD